MNMKISKKLLKDFTHYLFDLIECYKKNKWVLTKDQLKIIIEAYFKDF